MWQWLWQWMQASHCVWQSRLALLFIIIIIIIIFFFFFAVFADKAPIPQPTIARSQHRTADRCVCFLTATRQLTITANHCEPLTIANFQRPTANRCRLPITANHCQSLPTTANHCQSLPTTANHCQPLPPNATQCQPLPTTANHCQLPTATHCATAAR
jgi:hypothetical protein